jgi:hypothetical protein
MTSLLTAAILAGTVTAAQGGTAGAAPASIGALVVASRVSLATGDQQPCAITGVSTWNCSAVAVGASAVVVLVGDRGVTMVPAPGGAPAPVGQWGRILRIVPGGATKDMLHDLVVTAWRPDRPAVRPRSRRLMPVADPSTNVLPLSPTVVWVGGDMPERDAYILVEASAIAGVRVSTARLAEGPPDVPVMLSADGVVPLAGHVETKAGQAVQQASIDLFEPLMGTVDDPAPLHEQTLVRRATAQSNASGEFEFGHLGAGRYLLVAADAAAGRGTAEVQGVGPPVVIRLVPPRHALGRVLRRGLPVSSGRVRFLADPAAWADSQDATLHIAPEGATGPDGRFVLALPPNPAGSIVITAGEDGATIRREIPGASDGDVELGDIAIPDPRPLMLRQIGGQTGCVIVATGPLSGIGLTVLRASALGGTFSLDLPEPGPWALIADCGGREAAVEPPVVIVAPAGPLQSIDVVVRPRRGPGPLS